MLTFDGDNLQRLKIKIGRRPGNYTVDSDYIRKDTKLSKPLFWDAENKRWVGIRIGDCFFYDGTMWRKTGYTTWEERQREKIH